MKVIATGQFTVYLVSDEVTARLSSYIHGVPTDANGENGDYAGASTTLTVVDGSTDVTSKWNITYEESSVVGFLSGATYTVTNLLAESAVVTFRAKREGYSDVIKEFKVIKSRQGIAGEDARNYYMNTDVSNIKQLRNGTFIPSNIEFNGKLRIGSRLPEDYSGYFVVYEQSRNAITVDDYTNLAQQGLIAKDSEYIISDLAYPYVERYSSSLPESHIIYDYKANPNMLLIEFYDDIDRKNILDIKTIPIVIDGSSAYNMSISPSDGIVFKFNKDNSNIGVPSTTLTAVSTNIDNAKFVWEKDGVVVSGNTSDTLTVNSSVLTSVDSASYRCTVSGIANGEDVVLSDTVTVIKAKDGANGLPAYSISLVNDTVNISTEADGTGYDLSNARTGVILYLGTTSKTGTIGTITASGCTATTDGTTMWLTGIDSGVNDGYVDIQIKDGATIVGVKRFTFSKNRKGADGRTPYFHTAWANSVDGKVDFSITDSDKKRYIGTYADYVATDSTDHTKYKWVDMVGSIEIGGRNLLNNTGSEWEDLTLDAGQTITYVHPEATLKQDSTYIFTVEYETNDATIDVQVGTGLLGYEQDIVGWNATSIPSNQRVSLTHKVLESELVKSTNTGESRNIFAYKITNKGTNSTIRYRRQQLEHGNIPTDWNQAPEDVVDIVIGIESRLKNAESVISADAITNTVMGTTTFNAKLAEYATEDSLTGYATTGALDGVSAVADLAKKAIDELDLTPYVKSTQMTQLEDSITTKISQSGGINLLRNSIGWSEIGLTASEPWTIVSGVMGAIQTHQLEAFGFGSGWHKAHGVAPAKIKQIVNLPIAGTYTISFKMNKNIETAVGGKYSACGVYVDDLPFYGEGTGSGVTSGFEDYSLTFTTTKLTAEISIVIGELAEATISGVMLNIGSSALHWTSHNTEMYNTNVRNDINGIQVMGNRDGKRTVITTEEFAGYENNEKVFWVSGRTTKVKELEAEERFTMAPISIVTIDNGIYSGWAFI